MPVYLHPRVPLSNQQCMYQGHEGLLGSAWGFGVETATHGPHKQPPTTYLRQNFYLTISMSCLRFGLLVGFSGEREIDCAVLRPAHRRCHRDRGRITRYGVVDAATIAQNDKLAPSPDRHRNP